jgi:hypothetical protein
MEAAVGLYVTFRVVCNDGSARPHGRLAGARVSSRQADLCSRRLASPLLLRTLSTHGTEAGVQIEEVLSLNKCNRTGDSSPNGSSSGKSTEAIRGPLRPSNG